jgi:hypothetical protein
VTAPVPSPARPRSRRPLVYAALALLGATGVGLYFLAVMLAVARVEFARGLGLHCLLSTAERYREYSGLDLPPSAEVIAEEYDDWAFMDPRYRLVFRLSEADLKKLLAGRPPWAEGGWKQGTRVEAFGKPADSGRADTYSVSGVHGTTVFQGFNVDRDAREVEFICSSM